MNYAKAVFIDRDGTIVKDVPYCSHPDDLELLTGAGEGIRKLNEARFKVIIVTNQSGIARGYFSVSTLEQIHQKLRNDLVKYGAHIDDIYYCPHHPDYSCDCRKPKPTLILQAATEHNIDLSESFFIGDTVNDMEAGRKAGCKTVLLIPSKTPDNYQAHRITPDFIVSNFRQAVEEIIVPLTQQRGRHHIQ